MNGYKFCFTIMLLIVGPLAVVLHKWIYYKRRPQFEMSTLVCYLFIVGFLLLEPAFGRSDTIALDGNKKTCDVTVIELMSHNNGDSHDLIHAGSLLISTCGNRNDRTWFQLTIADDADTRRYVTPGVANVSGIGTLYRHPQRLNRG